MKPVVDIWRYFRGAVPFRLAPAIAATVLLAVLLLMPVPAGLTPNGWRLLAIFLTTILAIILKVMPIGVIAMMAMMAVALSRVTSDTSRGAIADALSSLSSPLIWLIVVSVLISRGLKKTGLGARIGYYFIALLGRSTVGIGYGLAVCELLLAPFTPSNTARGGGIVHPIMKSIAQGFGSDPEHGTEKKVGTYLALVNYHANPISSAMFVTATAPNPLVVDYVARVTHQQFHLSWGTWALAMLLPGLVCMALMPLVVYVLARPQVTRTPDAVTQARRELAAMGRLRGGEWVMLGTFSMLLLLWADVPALLLGPAFSLDATVVALLGLFVLLITGTLDWDDVLGEKSAWDTLIWFGALVMLAGQLGKLGVVAWFSDALRGGILASGMGWPAAATLLVLVFLFSHYFFASTTAHISAMMLAMLTVGAAMVPADYLVPFILMMVAASCIMMALTHYATGTSPIVFGSGYVGLGQWWLVGFVMAVVNLLVFATVGLLWWKVLGYW